MEPITGGQKSGSECSSRAGERTSGPWPALILLWIIIASSPGGPLVACAAPGDTPVHGPPEATAATSPGVAGTNQELPPGAARRLGTTRWRAVGGISGITFLADGGTIATAGSASITFWSRTTGRPRNQIRPPGETWEAAIVRADGRTRAVFQVGGLKVLQWPGGEVIGDLGSYDGDEIDTIEFVAGGARLVVRGFRRSGEDGAPFLDVWDVDEGRLVRTLSIPPSDDTYTPNVVLHPDGSRLVHILCGKAVRVLDVESGRTIATVPLPEVPRSSLSVALGGDALALAEWSWETRSGLLRFGRVGATDGVFRVKVGSPGSVHLSEDGRTLAFVAGQGRISIFDVVQGRRLGRITHEGPDATDVSFSPEGRTIAWDSGKIHVYDVATGRALNPDSGGLAYPQDMLISPGGRYLVTGLGWTGLAVWDMEAGRTIPLARKYHLPEPIFAFSRDETLLATATESGSGGGGDRIVIYNLPSGEILTTIEDVRPQGLAFSPDGSALAMATYYGALRIFDVPTGEERSGFAVTAQDRSGAVGFSPAGDTIWCSGEPLNDTWTLLSWTFPGGGVPTRQTGKHPGDVVALIQSIGGRRLAHVADSRSDVYLADVKSGEKLVSFGEYWDLEMALSPDGRFYARVEGEPEPGKANDEGGIIRVYETTTGARVREFRPEAGGVSCLTFTPDGRHLASAGGDTTIVLWDLVPAEEGAALRAGGMRQAWDDLARGGPERSHAAYRALWWLIAGGDAVVEFIQRKMTGTPEAAEAASANEPFIHKTFPSEAARHERAIAALERIGSAKALSVLTEIVSSGPTKAARQDAGAAAGRLTIGRRRNEAPSRQAEGE